MKRKETFMLKIKILHMLCLFSCSLLAFSNRQGEFMIDTSVVSKPGIGEQRSPAVAFDGTNYMLVYVDYRNGTPNIFATLIDQQGTIITSEGFPITREFTQGQTNPAIIHDGNNYFVVWQESRSHFGQNGNEICSYDICCARVDNNGVPIDYQPIVLTNTLHHDVMPVVAFNGVNYLVAWVSRSNTDGGLQGKRVSSTGQVLDSIPIIIEPNFTLVQNTAISCADSTFIVIWNGFYQWAHGIYGARVNQYGQLIDTTAITIYYDYSVSCPNLDMASNNIDYQVVFQQRPFGSGYSDIWGIRLNANGVVIDTIPILISGADSSQCRPAIAFNGNEYLVTWEDKRNGQFNFDIYGARVNVLGQLIDTSGIALCIFSNSCQQKSCVASGSGQWLVAWEDQRNTQLYRSDIYSARMASSGNVLDPNGIDMRIKWAGEQILPDIAYDGTNYLCVWNESRTGGLPYLFSEVYGLRIEPSGQILDSNAICLARKDLIDQLFPKIAFDGANYLVVWHDHYDRILGKRITPGGVLLDSNIIISDSVLGERNMLDIIYGDEIYMVTWHGYYDLCGVMVRPNGQVLDSTKFNIDCQTYFGGDIALGFDNENFLFVWSAISFAYEWGVYGVRVSPYGTIIDTCWILVSRIPNNRPKRTENPCIAYGDSIYFVVWSDIRNSMSQWPPPADSIDIYAARVTREGVVLDTNNIRVSYGAGRHLNPTAIFDGQNFLVIWEDSRNNDSYDLFGALVDPQGNILSSGPVVIQPGDQLEPVLVKGDNQIMLFYSGWTDSINGHWGNIRRIWTKIDPTIYVGEKGAIKVNSINSLTLIPTLFHRSIRIAFSISENAAQGYIEIYDICGRQVWRSDDFGQGIHSIEWRGRDLLTRDLSSGVYLCRLVVEDESVSKKMVFLK